MLRYRKRLVHVLILGLVAGIAAAAPGETASAQGFLDFLFGGFRRHLPAPPQVNVSPPAIRPQHQESVRGAEGGARAAFCVRLCDGRYFPIESHRDMSAAEQCHSVCPAAQTKLFSGSEIDRAVASDGTRYASLPNAFVYRKHLVASCTCNGTSTSGLAHIAVADDPTLRPGDIVATESGLSVYNGRSRDGQTNFTPVSAAKLSSAVRAQLATIEVATPSSAMPTANAAQGSAPAASSPRRAQPDLSSRTH